MASDLMYKGEGKTHSGFRSPYSLWVWKQNEYFRNIHEYQFEHLRKVYRRQWYEAYRVNADEYIHKYNQTKAAQLTQWEQEMEIQDKTRRDSLQMASGRKALREKHRDIVKEYRERDFFMWYERASERLQYMSKIQFLPRESLDAHIDAELDKYVTGKHRSYPLNFVGQMPLLETDDLEVQSVPSHLAQHYRNEFPASQVDVVDPPVADDLSGSGGGSGGKMAGDISLEDISADVAVVDDVIATVVDELAKEQDSLLRVDQDKDNRTTTISATDRRQEREQSKTRGQPGWKRKEQRPPEMPPAEDGGADDSSAPAASKDKKARPGKKEPVVFRPADLEAAAKALKRRGDAAKGDSGPARPKMAGKLQWSGPSEEGLQSLVKATDAGASFRDPKTARLGQGDDKQKESTGDARPPTPQQPQGKKK